jgi:NUDIX domain
LLPFPARQGHGRPRRPCPPRARSIGNWQWGERDEPKKRRIDYWQHPDAPKPTNRKASASVVVRDESGRVLVLRRPDNDLWTIPTGAVKRGETVAEAAVR